MEVGATYSQSQNTKPNSKHIALAQKLGLDTFIVSTFLFNRLNYYYHHLKSGHIDSLSFDREFTFNKWDTTNFSKQPVLDQETEFMLGTKKNGELLLIADQNNNNDLSDDRVFTFTSWPQQNNATKLIKYPYVKIKNLESYKDGKIRKYAHIINLRPAYKQKLVSNYLPFTILNLMVVKTNFVWGKFKYKGAKYRVGVRNDNLERQDFVIKLAKKNEPIILSTRVSSIRANIGDTLLFDRNLFQVSVIEPASKKIVLKPLLFDNMFVNKNNLSKETRIIGTVYPSFKIENDTTFFSNEDIKAKTVFVNFWFAACPPCIAEFEGLNQLYQQFKDNKNFEFLSFTFEKSDVIEKFRSHYNLPFKIYSIEADECRRLNLNSGYPVNIIIDENGLIRYYREGGLTSKEEATTYIQNKIFPKIMELIR